MMIAHTGKLARVPSMTYEDALARFGGSGAVDSTAAPIITTDVAAITSSSAGNHYFLIIVQSLPYSNQLLA